MEQKEELYFFRHGRLGAIYKTKAINSDVALEKCLDETGWKRSFLLYEGKEGRLLNEVSNYSEIGGKNEKDY